MSCAPSWIYPEDFSYNLFLVTLGFFIPLVIIIVTSFIVIGSLQRQYSGIINSDVKACATSRQLKVIKMVILHCWNKDMRLKLSSKNNFVPVLSNNLYLHKNLESNMRPDFITTFHKLYLSLNLGFITNLVILVTSRRITSNNFLYIWTFKQIEATYLPFNSLNILFLLQVCLLVFVFLFCWTPYAILSIAGILGNPAFVSLGLSVFPLQFAKSAVLWNPVIYILMNPTVRVPKLLSFHLTKWHFSFNLPLESIYPPLSLASVKGQFHQINKSALNF